MKASAQAATVVRFEISPRSIAWILATIVGVWLFFQLRAIALLLVVALVFAGTFNPLVEWLERRGLKRIYALTLLFVAMLLVTSLLIFLTVPPLLEQLTQIVRDAPRHREQLIALLQQRDFTAPLARALQNAGLEQTFARIESSLVGYTAQALTALGWAVTTLFLTFYLLADGKRTQGALYALVPRDYHMRLARILQNLETIVGGYMRGQLITSVAIGVFTYLLLVICGVPNALSLALFAAVVDVIPIIGALLATAPAVLVALSKGLPTGLVVLVALFIYQELENRILIPKVYGRVLRLSPTTIVLALLAGGILLGVIGALLALPIAAGLQMMLQELRVELPGDDSADRVADARDAKTEATYERMSAGATAPEAGQIAKNLAQDIREEDAVKEAAGVAS
ncbi:MAG TPA: AI-2E family transporter [Gemmatimonadales bacterium]|jgi:predicted PurR-regulated permease PerM|nr:AI-2E family transporter [Gemmatimonadales bacterium]